MHWFLNIPCIDLIVYNQRSHKFIIYLKTCKNMISIKNLFTGEPAEQGQDFSAEAAWCDQSRLRWGDEGQGQAPGWQQVSSMYIKWSLLKYIPVYIMYSLNNIYKWKYIYPDSQIIQRNWTLAWYFKNGCNQIIFGTCGII